MEITRERRSIQSELFKMGVFKEHWYALITCICSEKEISMAKAFNGMGIHISKEAEISKKIAPKLTDFEKTEIEALYKELGSIRQVAMHLEVGESTLNNYFKAQNIKTFDTRPLISDKFNKPEIFRLYKEGKNMKEISVILGYHYGAVLKFMKVNIKQLEVDDER